MNAEQARIQCWDIDAGYAAAHEQYRCQDPLIASGFDETRGMPSYMVQDLAMQLDDTDYIPASDVVDKKHVFEWFFGRMCVQLGEYFQCCYAPAFCSMLKMGPMGKEVDESYCWHVDNGPTSHLKLVVYLNDDHDGATAVMSREDSRKFIDAGYLQHRRMFYLDEFAADHGISYTPYKVQPKAGSGLIFEPTNVLHKGVYPTFGERRVFQIGIIPWGEPWDRFYQQHWEKGYINSNGFPRYEAGQIA